MTINGTEGHGGGMENPHLVTQGYPLFLAEISRGDGDQRVYLVVAWEAWSPVVVPVHGTHDTADTWTPTPGHKHGYGATWTDAVRMAEGAP